jgi:hypothetical protein
MIPNDPVVEFFAGLFFALVLIWALWEGLPEFTLWLEHSSDDRDDIHFFPDEVRGEAGPGRSANISRRD